MAVQRMRIGSHEDEAVTLDFYVEDTTNTLVDIEYKNDLGLPASMHVTNLLTGVAFSFELIAKAPLRRIPIPGGPVLDNVSIATAYPAVTAARGNRNAR
ncbi:MAG: hypothetical protein M3Q49_19425 [Actinomycetota bacterium]|nr:hypothetical protein [Actinomycetota bacterium]